jgi:hypothetical protein
MNSCVVQGITTRGNRCRRQQRAHSNAAPEMCGVAMDVPLKFAHELSLARWTSVLVRGSDIRLDRLLPSIVTGPRLLKEAIVSVPVFNAPGR